MAVTKKRGLGKGLDALLSVGQEQAFMPTSEVDAESTVEKLHQLPIEWLQPGPYQPRSDIAEDKLEELAQSIRTQGMIQPIVVRDLGRNRYEIIAGERRWRASQTIPLETVPCIVKKTSYESAALLALIENIQREDLNVVEEAAALERLQKDFNLTHQAISDAIGKSRSAVTNTLRLNQLHPDVRKQLGTGDLEMGHARALLSLPRKKQIEAGRLIAQKGFNVRETEKLVKRMQEPAENLQTNAKKDPNLTALEHELSNHLGTNVSIQHQTSGSGKLVLHYQNLDEMDKLIKLLK